MNLLQQKRVLTKENSLTSQLRLRLQHGDRFVVLAHLYGCGGFIWIIIRWIIHYSLWILLDGMLRVRQDESNPALWLATWAVKMALSCPLGITPCALQQNIVFLRNIINPLLTRLVLSFLACLWTWTPSRSKNTQKKTILANIQPCSPHALSIIHIKNRQDKS